MSKVPSSVAPQKDVLFLQTASGPDVRLGLQLGWRKLRNPSAVPGAMSLVTSTVWVCHGLN
jgi:hypothetical protein